MTICGVAILLPPAPTVVLQCLVALLTFNGPAFCATQASRPVGHGVLS